MLSRVLKCTAIKSLFLLQETKDRFLEQNRHILKYVRILYVTKEESYINRKEIHSTITKVNPYVLECPCNDKIYFFKKIVRKYV